jgi:dihydroorotase-like cyclic amidohydrolase
VREVVPARVKAGQWARLVRGLVDTPDGRGTAAQAALVRLTSLLARRGLAVLVSDLLFDRELALTALRYLRHRGHQVIVLHLMDPAEAELSGAPEVRYRDPESAASVVVRPRELARAYRITVQREIDAWRTACRRHGIVYHHILTDMPFGVALRLLA